MRCYSLAVGLIHDEIDEWGMIECVGCGRCFGGSGGENGAAHMRLQE